MIFDLDLVDADDWDVDALCAQVDPEMFFPEGPPSAIHSQVVAAQQVCADCPVKQKCARRALTSLSVSGVWAGVYMGSHALDRRYARERLEEIAGTTAPAPRAGGVRPPRGPFACAGSCGRSVRPMGRLLEEYPDTVSHHRKGMCGRCYREHELATAGVA
ncbi:WhiB family transcriptional regulator [Rhodococcus sp. B10]|uniref:WhiB family transcriptional regulator n=1 Tax=Rhodococcus sp. B10 TaxID=2695876 RepID=UPI00142FC1F3|nr:WhiB family transcriptional regulator [Rhodococcus sp. B10]NIL77666.1 Transcriptional regulator WhiB [Rhodococcus sp. B10]